MKPKIAMIGIVTNQLPTMTAFYRDTIGFEVQLELDGYVEFKSEGVRFAITTNETMHAATGHSSYTESKNGHAFELAFPVPTPPEVDTAYAELLEKGATAIKAPEDMPWNQRAAFIADPDGNIHEIFADLPL